MLHSLFLLVFLVQFSGNHVIVREEKANLDVNLDRTVEENSSNIHNDRPSTSVQNSISTEKGLNDGGFIIYSTIPEGSLASYTLLRRVFRALNSILNFYSKYYREMNLDAVVGVRMAEDQLQVLLSYLIPRLDGTKRPKIRRIIQELRDKTRRVANKAVFVLEDQDSDYFYRMRTLTTEGFWEIYYKSRETSDSSPEENHHRDGKLQGGTSDRCITALLGTKYNRPCKISDGCWKYMTALNSKEYYLTHQTLYMIIGERAGCKREIEQRAKKDDARSLDSQLNFFCSSIRKEADHVVSHVFAKPYNKDLFIEQGLFCGMLGFRNFFKYNWLQLILRWQSSMGCYKEVDFTEMTDSYGRRNELDLQYFLNLGLKSPQERLPSAEETSSAVHQFPKKSKDSLSRVRRNNRLMTGHCSAHTTAMAAGNLALYIRYILEAIIKQTSA